nr:hypothetical protein [Corynebacterium auriscanis]
MRVKLAPTVYPWTWNTASGPTRAREARSSEGVRRGAEESWAPCA